MAEKIVIPDYDFDVDIAKEFLERAEEDSTLGWVEREKLRGQLKVITLTVSATIIGYVFGRENPNYSLLFIVPAFLFFSHIQDAILSDLSIRQIAHRKNIKRLLLALPKLKEDNDKGHSLVDSVLEGIGKPDRWKKFCVFLWGGFQEGIWHWGLFVGTLLLALWFTCWKE